MRAPVPLLLLLLAARRTTCPQCDGDGPLTKRHKICGKEVSQDPADKMCACTGSLIYGFITDPVTLAGTFTRAYEVEGCTMCNNAMMDPGGRDGVAPIARGKTCYCDGNTTLDGNLYDTCRPWAKNVGEGNTANCGGTPALPAETRYRRKYNFNESDETMQAKKNVSGDFPCTNAFFGGDPGGGSKQCDCRPNKALWVNPVVVEPSPFTKMEFTDGYPRRQMNNDLYFTPQHHVTLEWPQAAAGECAVSLYKAAKCDKNQKIRTLKKGAYPDAGQGQNIQSWLIAGKDCVANITKDSGGVTQQWPAGGLVSGVVTNPDPCVEFPWKGDKTTIVVWSGNWYREKISNPTRNDGLSITNYANTGCPFGPDCEGDIRGGPCTCPDGQVYEVENSGRDCENDNGRALSCTGGTMGPCTYHDHRQPYAGKGMVVTCATLDPPASQFDHACQLGDVALPKNGFDPYIWAAGGWKPVCMHYFQDNRVGASIICRMLGYNGGFGTVYHVGNHNERLGEVVAWRIGRCLEHHDILNCDVGANKHFTDWICRGGHISDIGLLCDGDNGGRNATCDESLPVQRPADPQTPCKDGDVMLKSDRNLNGNTMEEPTQLNGGAGVPYVLHNGRWAPICNTGKFRTNNWGAQTLCSKLGFTGSGSTSGSFGARIPGRGEGPSVSGSFMSLWSDLPPSINIGECKEGEELLECTGGENTRDYPKECADQGPRSPLVITCPGTFQGTAASCNNWVAFEIVSVDTIGGIAADPLRVDKCPANTDPHPAGLRYPSEMMICPTSPVVTTECTTFAAPNLYQRIVQAIAAMYDSLDAECDQTCCPQADLAGCILRMAGHDFMDFRGGSGGSDGCIDFDDLDNKGLYPCLAGDGEFRTHGGPGNTPAPGKTLDSVYGVFCHEVSLADFLVVAAEAVMMRTRADWDGARSPTLDLEQGFEFGRTSAATCAPPPLPFPEDSCMAVKDNFIDALGLDWTGAAALMGVHTLGRAQRDNIGYDGWWNQGPEAKNFSNSYYVSVIAKGWVPKEMSATPPRNQWVRAEVGATSLEMMLDTDICLLFESGPKSVKTPLPTSGSGAAVETKQTMAAKDCCCAWTAQDPNGLDGVTSLCSSDGVAESETCCSAGGESGNTCNDEFDPQGVIENGVRTPAAAAMKLYAKDEAAWLASFLPVWRKVTRNGRSGLFAENTCDLSAPPSAAPSAGPATGAATGAPSAAPAPAVATAPPTAATKDPTGAPLPLDTPTASPALGSTEPPSRQDTGAPQAGPTAQVGLPTVQPQVAPTTRPLSAGSPTEPPVVAPISYPSSASASPSSASSSPSSASSSPLRGGVPVASIAPFVKVEGNFDECDLLADPCAAASPASAGATCMDPNSMATSLGDFFCTCVNGAGATTTAQGGPAVCHIDECVPVNPCGDDQDCNDPDTTADKAFDYTCTCRKAAAGSGIPGVTAREKGTRARCEVDECQLVTDLCGVHQSCQDVNQTALSSSQSPKAEGHRDYICTCLDDESKTMQGKPATCAQSAACATAPCASATPPQRCVETGNGGYMCVCNPPFLPEYRLDMVVPVCGQDECAPGSLDMCGAGQMCIDTDTLSKDVWNCTCLPPFHGTLQGGPAECWHDDCSVQPCSAGSQGDPDSSTQRCADDRKERGRFTCTCVDTGATAANRPAKCVFDECVERASACADGEACTDPGKSRAEIGDFRCGAAVGEGGAGGDAGGSASWVWPLVAALVALLVATCCALAAVVRRQRRSAKPTTPGDYVKDATGVNEMGQKSAGNMEYQNLEQRPRSQSSGLSDGDGRDTQSRRAGDDNRYGPGYRASSHTSSNNTGIYSL